MIEKERTDTYKDDAKFPQNRLGDLNDPTAGRNSARVVLQNVIAKKARELDAMSALELVIPWGLLPKREEDLLWNLFQEWVRL